MNYFIWKYKWIIFQCENYFISQYQVIVVTIPIDYAFTGGMKSLWEWISNLIPHFIMGVITFASVRRFSVRQRMPTVWTTSEEHPRNLLNVWPAHYERTLDAWQRVSSNAAHTLDGEKSFVHVHFFRSLAWENESGRVRTFATRVQRSQVTSKWFRTTLDWGITTPEDWCRLKHTHTHKKKKKRERIVRRPCIGRLTTCDKILPHADCVWLRHCQYRLTDGQG